ncbi:hypothetical protein SDC9_201065 [bioreactor metagenome]|uniref:Uncharacterized protein n=1 Tax=bioreactor metagenome TaxID=1076179 RepID=A0A645IPZ5_9ZZZZ
MPIATDRIRINQFHELDNRMLAITNDISWNTSCCCHHFSVNHTHAILTTRNKFFDKYTLIIFSGNMIRPLHFSFRPDINGYTIAMITGQRFDNH